MYTVAVEVVNFITLSSNLVQSTKLVAQIK